MRSNWPAIAILAAYLVVGSLYAAGTPAWQAPDEPAHYNYVRALATGEGIPVMEAGDYDQDYISRLTREGFPPDLSVLPLEYEDHQPPLYYLLATPIYWLSGGDVLSLRLFSLLLGGVGVAMLFLLIREFRPAEPAVAWLGGGLVAFVPQFVAMTASVN
ncbi:MAG: glycosyltransferase family 39 protein, partial [Anaerolineae bacterium]|nr:glycosyltransferase family 39 protein [Anaerolineae bacterium]